MSGLLKKERTLPCLAYDGISPKKFNEFTTKAFIESAGEPIFFFRESSLSLVPAITNITFFSNCILSNKAASGEIKFGFISKSEPNDKFQTCISGFSSTTCSMFLIIVRELLYLDYHNHEDNPGHYGLLCVRCGQEGGIRLRGV